MKQKRISNTDNTILSLLKARQPGYYDKNFVFMYSFLLKTCPCPDKDSILLKEVFSEPRQETEKRRVKLTESGDFLTAPRKAARLRYHRDPHYSLLTFRSLELLKKFSDVKAGI